MVSNGDSIYIMGGRLCQKKRSQNNDKFVEFNVKVVSTMLCYNVRTNLWNKCAPMSLPRYDFACTILNNKIYVAGGKSNLTSARGMLSAEVYNPQTNTWSNLPNMSTMRYKCVGVTWQDKFHVVGGFAERAQSESDHTILRSSAEVYDIESGKWNLSARMWQLDVPPNQIVVLDNKLFSSGDCLKAWKGHIEKYDGNLNIWNEVDGSHLEMLHSPLIVPSRVDDFEEEPIRRLYLTMAPIGTHLYFLVGHRTAGEVSRTMSMVHMFDTRGTSGDAWRSFESTVDDGEKELCTHCCVVQLSL